MILPYFTPDFAGIGGTLKNRVEDFFVQEIPLYEPADEGEHIYVEIQKAGIPTFEAVHRLARSLRVPQRNIGYAGLKDARAVTRQIFSIAGTTEAAVMSAYLPDMTVQWAARHRNKLRLGHLAGNRFAIKVRDVQPTDVIRLRPVIDLLTRRGSPNYFGEQRFGRRDNNHQLGAALLRNDHDALLHDLLGNPDETIDDADALAARQAFEQRDFETSLKAWPRNYGLECRVLSRLVKTGNPAAAVGAIDQKLRRLWVSALQSRIFNEIVAARISSLDRLMDGDLAYRHDNGACFLVESALIEQTRCDAFEISPSGPLLGSRTDFPLHDPRQIEIAVMNRFGVSVELFRGIARGARRPLRVRPMDVSLEAGVDEHGPYITVAFTLPAGAYATVFMRELMKTDLRGSSRTPGADERSNTEHDEDAAEDGHEAEA